MPPSDHATLTVLRSSHATGAGGVRGDVEEDPRMVHGMSDEARALGMVAAEEQPPKKYKRDGRLEPIWLRSMCWACPKSFVEHYR
jgi:hypothetical protein